MKLQGIATSDFQGLHELGFQAKTNAKQALPEVAKQFESIFLQSMLKNMRTAQHFLDDSNPLSGKNQAMFQEMLDGQYASNIANSKGIGFASLLTKQLENTVGGKATQPNGAFAFDAKKVTVPTKLVQNKDSSTATSIDDFVQSIWPKAKAAAASMGLDPKILMAQAALETGWGKFVAKDADGSSSNNLFNIKAHSNKDDESVQVKTTEYIAGTPIKTTASFRKYASVEQSFNDYISLIKGSERYQTAVANASNPEQYINELHKAGYATDPQYGNKILSIYNGDELNQALQRCGMAEQI